MKTASADYSKSNYTIPIDLRSHPYHHVHIHLPALNIKRILRRTDNQLKWVAVTMLVQSIIITPLISVIILSTGNWMPLWFLATASMYATFIPSLSGQKVRWVKIVFLVNCFVSILIIVAAFAHSLIA